MKLLHSPKRAQLHARRNKFLFLYKANGSLAFQDRAGGGTLTGSGAVRYAPASGAVFNYVHNGSFETGISGWATYTGSGSVASRVHETSESYQGTKSQRLDITSISGGVGVALASSSFAPTNGGQQWSAGVWVKTTPGVTVKLYIFAYNAAGAYLGNNPSPPVSTGSGSWEYLTATWSVTAGASRVGIGVYHAGGSAPCSIWTDAAILCPGASVPTFFDGSTGGVWLDPITGILGTAHASPSVSQAVAWVEEGTTNASPNPSMETDVGNWAARGAGTVSVTRVTTYAMFGSASALISGDGTAASQGTTHTSNVIAAAQSQTWTCSAYVRGSGTIRIGIQERSAANAFLTSGNSGNFTLSDTWTRITFTYTTTNASCAFIGHYFETPSAAALTMYMDGVQLEQKAYATSYCDGAIGTGYAWSGTAHASSSTRTAAYLQVDEVNHISSIRGTFAARLLRTIDNGANGYIMWAGIDGTNDFIGPRIDSSDRASLICKVGAGSYSVIQRTGAITVDTWLSLFAGWDGAAIALSINDETQTTGTRDDPGGSVSSGSDLRFAANSSGTSQINGYIGPVAIFDDTLTPREREKLNDHTQWEWGMLRDAA